MRDMIDDVIEKKGRMRNQMKKTMEEKLYVNELNLDSFYSNIENPTQLRKAWKFLSLSHPQNVLVYIWKVSYVLCEVSNKWSSIQKPIIGIYREYSCLLR